MSLKIEKQDSRLPRLQSLPAPLASPFKASRTSTSQGLPAPLKAGTPGPLKVEKRVVSVFSAPKTPQPRAFQLLGGLWPQGQDSAGLGPRPQADRVRELSCGVVSVFSAPRNTETTRFSNGVFGDAPLGPGFLEGWTGL